MDIDRVVVVGKGVLEVACNSLACLHLDSPLQTIMNKMIDNLFIYEEE